MVIGEDLGPYNMGPKWLFTPLAYNSDENKTIVVIRSPSLKTTVDFPIKSI